MTTVATTHHFTKRIKSRGETANGGASLTFDWKLPGSQFDFVLYERDPAKVASWNVGDTPEVTISQGALKKDKQGTYASDYFWNLVEIQAPGWAEPPTADDPGPPMGDSAYGPPEAPPLPQALGACQNHAMAFIESGIIPVPEGRDPISFLWELRDRVYRNVNQKPYQPEHFCYEHDKERIKSPKTGVWGHVLKDGKACVEPGPDLEAITGPSGPAKGTVARN